MMFFYELQHMDTPVLTNQQSLTYNNFVWIPDAN